MSKPSQIRRPIRLALVITELAVGGAERNLVRLATGLQGDGFEVRVFSLKEAPQPPRDALAVALEQAGVPTSFLNVRSAWQIPFATRRLAKTLYAWRPDVVQSFLFHANIISAWACRMARAPNLVWGLRVADPNPRRQWLERRLADRAARVVCVSESVKQFASAKLRLNDARLRVIPNGLDPSEFENIPPIDLTAFGLLPGRRALLCVGRLHEQKGLDWLLSLMPQLLERLPQHDLVCVGDGPQRRRLETLAQELGLPRRVHFVGFRNDVPRWLAAADLLLLPSRWEGMPNVVLEAMASGRPVVATASHGVAEALGDSSGPQIVAGPDAAVFQHQVVTILSDPKLASSLGQANRKRIQTHFSQAAATATYCQLYCSLALK